MRALPVQSGGALKELKRMPISSRAAIMFEPHKPLRIETVQVADPGPGEVLIKLEIASLCHSDLGHIDTDWRFPA